MKPLPKFFKKSVTKNTVFLSPLRPHSDWRKLVLSFCVVCLGVVGWSLYLFLQSETEVTPDSFQSGNSSVQKTPFERVDDYFAPVIDPSL
jgi:hypothetical protein